MSPKFRSVNDGRRLSLKPSKFVMSLNVLSITLFELLNFLSTLSSRRLPVLGPGLSLRSSSSCGDGNHS